MSVEEALGTGAGVGAAGVEDDRIETAVGHGLTPDTRALLINGTMDAVITQSPQMAIQNCARMFINLREHREPHAGVEITRGQVIFRENLP